ncbi:hypothetical protein LAZ67_17002962 [Cordylochernes scorpioides]|uniref:Uncharacterized protein n=1 Tax=Cordylochernes scorpioides TaxID=51811 RepID=A0ABY6LFQ7_9ARAC|nr:hypothetical protein LAZ67_17002962 [Cordylochernes scorpioides]
MIIMVSIWRLLLLENNKKRSLCDRHKGERGSTVLGTIRKTRQEREREKKFPRGRSQRKQSPVNSWVASRGSIHTVMSSGEARTSCLSTGSMMTEMSGTSGSTVW